MAPFTLALIVIVVVGSYAKISAWRSSRCQHCGHDNGLTGWQAAICPACGRNKTIASHRRARKL